MMSETEIINRLLLTILCMEEETDIKLLDAIDRRFLDDLYATGKYLIPRAYSLQTDQEKKQIQDLLKMEVYD